MPFSQSNPPDIEKLKTQRNIKKLIDALKHEEAHIRFQAQKALGELKDTRALKPLLSMLKDSDSDYRESAAEALGELKDTQAIEPLLSALKDSEGNVRSAAIRALRDIHDARAVEPLIAMLKDSDWWVRLAAADALGVLKDKRAIEPLHTAFEDGEESALWALARLQDVRAFEPLIAKLGDNDEAVRANAAMALVALKDTRTAEALIAKLNDSDGSVRANAAAALGQLKDARAVEPLIAKLNDNDGSVRANAAAAVGELRDTRAVEPLILALKDSDPITRRAAVRALDKLGWSPDQGEVGATYLAVKKERKCTKLTCSTVLAGAGYQCWECSGIFCERCVQIATERAARFFLGRIQDSGEILTFGTVGIVDHLGRAYCPNCIDGLLELTEDPIYVPVPAYEEQLQKRIKRTCVWGTPAIRQEASPFGIREIMSRYDGITIDRCFFFQPNIPKEKLLNALGAFAKDVLPEDVLVLVDDTAFGSAKDGAILTETHLYAHSMMQRPVSIELCNIEEVSYKKGGLTAEPMLLINGSPFLQAQLPSKEAMQRFTLMLNEVATTIRPQANGAASKDAPQLKADGTPTIPPKAPRMGIREIVERYDPTITDNHFFFQPNIPEKKLSNALEAIAKDVLPKDVLVLVDNSAFGSAKEGAILTETRLYAHSMMQRPVSIELGAIEEVSYKKGGLTTEPVLLVNGSPFLQAQLPSKEAMQRFTLMLNEIATTIRPQANTAAPVEASPSQDSP